MVKVPGSSKIFYKYTAIDDCTRIIISKIYNKKNHETEFTSAKTTQIASPPELVISRFFLVTS